MAYCLNHLTSLRFFVFPFYMILTEFCENSKVVSSDFSMVKNIVALLSSSMPIKSIYWFKLEFSNSICLLKSIAIDL